MKSFVKRTDYTTLPMGEMDEPAEKVRLNIYPNVSTFATPPITEPIFQAMLLDYRSKYIASKNGGPTAKGEFMISEATLLDALDEMALYVDTVADGNRAIILLSGFVPTKDSQTPKPAPTVLTDIELVYGATGQIASICERQEGVDFYCCIMTAGAPLPPNFEMSLQGQLIFSEGGPSGSSPSSGAIDMNKQRRKLFGNLTLGVEYFFVYIAINANGVSAMSTPVSIVCR